MVFMQCVVLTFPTCLKSLTTCFAIVLKPRKHGNDNHTNVYGVGGGHNRAPLLTIGSHLPKALNSRLLARFSISLSSWHVGQNLCLNLLRINTAFDEHILKKISTSIFFWVHGHSSWSTFGVHLVKDQRLKNCILRILTMKVWPWVKATWHGITLWSMM